MTTQHQARACIYTRLCWACTFDWDSPSHKHDGYWRAKLYEDAVELIEGWSGGFQIVSVWKALRAASGIGPEAYQITRNAVHDMAAHGLIVCARRSRDGKCREWRVNENL